MFRFHDPCVGAGSEPSFRIIVYNVRYDVVDYIRQELFFLRISWGDGDFSVAVRVVLKYSSSPVSPDRLGLAWIP